MKPPEQPYSTIILTPDRLDLPLIPLYAGKLSSAVWFITNVPDDIESVAVQIERTPDPDTHQPRDNFSAAATRQPPSIAYRCYLSPFHFPDVSAALQYHVIGTDTEANPRWLGTGQLAVKDNPADGSPVAPDLIPRDTYIRNPVTGFYHLLPAEVNDLGEVTIPDSPEGIER